MDSARNVIKRKLNPRLLSYVASHGVATTIHQSLPALKRALLSSYLPCFQSSGPCEHTH